MKYIIIIFISLVIINLIIFIFDYFYRKRKSNKIKIGDKKRIFINNEITFYYVTIIDIYYNNKKRKIAKCKNEYGEIENIPIIDLIY